MSTDLRAALPEGSTTPEAGHEAPAPPRFYVVEGDTTITVDGNIIALRAGQVLDAYRIDVERVRRCALIRPLEG